MNPLIQSKNTTILPVLIALTLGCFGLSPQARAVCKEGCLTNENTVLGDDALVNNIGVTNTAIGSNALLNNTSGGANTATGSQALFSNATGLGNTANGAAALIFNTTGGYNTASGYAALFSNTTGFNNTANGREALFLNTTGGSNTASGYAALRSNTTGGDNTASGFQALRSNTTGIGNTANGLNALYSNTIGLLNTANGLDALFFNTTGNNNTASGFQALRSNTTGIGNTAIGNGALLDNTTGSYNIALGSKAGLNLTTGDGNIDIGNPGRAGEINTIRIGTRGNQTNTYMAGISGAIVPTGVAVIVDAGGHLGTTTSSERLKEAIEPMDKASEAIHALKPVTFRYKHALDPEGIPQFGLVAEDVEKVNPDLVARDAHGKPYTVRYEAVNAMLLNEFLKEHRKNEQQEATIAQLKEDFRVTVARLSERLEKQASQIQRVSAQVEMSRPAPQMVVDNH